MTKDEHNKLLSDLKSAETDVARMEIITKLEQDYTSIISERDTAISTCNSAIEERDRYAVLNNQLWLENSSQNTNIDDLNKDTIQDEPPVKRTFGDLADKIEEEFRR